MHLRVIGKYTCILTATRFSTVLLFHCSNVSLIISFITALKFLSPFPYQFFSFSPAEGNACFCECLESHGCLHLIPLLILIAYQELHRNRYLIFNSVRYPDFARMQQFTLSTSNSEYKYFLHISALSHRFL